MANYQPRKIAFSEIVEVGEWKIKVYTIAKEGEFSAEETYKSAVAQLPTWLSRTNNFDDSKENLGFLILHQGTGGVFIGINWWVGGNMLNSHIFMTEDAQPTEFKEISGNGLAPCVWELIIVNHERIAWTEHALKKEQLDANGYLAEQINEYV